jgi:hypothetical protein
MLSLLLRDAARIQSVLPVVTVSHRKRADLIPWEVEPWKERGFLGTNTWKSTVSRKDMWTGRSLTAL